MFAQSASSGWRRVVDAGLWEYLERELHRRAHGAVPVVELWCAAVVYAGLFSLGEDEALSTLRTFLEAYGEKEGWRVETGKNWGGRVYPPWARPSRSSGRGASSGWRPR